MTTTRERILDAAMDVFAENGFRGATISEVERRVGLAVGTGSLYRHFPSKEALLQAAVEHEVARLRAEIAQERADLPHSDDPEESRRQRYEQVLQDVRRFDRVYRLMINDGERVPGLREAIWSAVQRPTDATTSTDDVTDAIALAALGGYHLYSLMQGRPFNGIAPDAFVAALLALTARDPAGPPPAAR